jgi:hypothetical protein
MIRSGISELQQTGASNLDAIRNAQQELVRFVSEMAKEATHRGVQELEESIFDKVKRALCPLPPWLREPCP